MREFEKAFRAYLLACVEKDIDALIDLYDPKHIAEEVGEELDRFAGARDLVWVQEEPANMGALFFAVPQIERVARGRHVRTVKRSASASPATGAAKAHKLEQKALLNLAFN